MFKFTWLSVVEFGLVLMVLDLYITSVLPLFSDENKRKRRKEEGKERKEEERVILENNQETPLQHEVMIKFF